MKKVALTILLFVVFGAYVLHQKSEGSEANVVAPKSVQNAAPTSSGSVATPTTATAASTPSSPTATSAPVSGQYKDGTYTSPVGDAFYGPLQIKITINSGKITDVVFLQYPSDRGTSVEINSQAMPYLKQEAIAAQNANVDIVTGATQTSETFRQLLDATLAQAKA